MDTNPLSPFGEKLFLDRYAIKDGTKESVRVGSVVIVPVNEGTSQREVGKVIDIKDGILTVALSDDSTITCPVRNADVPLETSISQLMARVAKGAASVEHEDIKDTVENKFFKILSDFRFVPGGRILSGCGSDQNLTFYNCYVIPSPEDSREGIFRSLGTMAEIMSRGGGVGVNISSLRPRFSYVSGVNGRSSGSVSWGGLFSFVTGLIEQGGSRRGALMLILNDWHPDILDFIEAKKQAGNITNANISVGISNEFMYAVKKDLDWTLKFPDTSDEKYPLWNGNLEEWNGAVINYKTVKAREIWDKIIESAWSSAEPGVWFRGRSNELSNSWYYEDLVCTNPCGEQPLPAWSVCNLGHINLSKFVDDECVNWDDLSETVKTAVRFLDNVIDVTPYFFEENEEQQKSERRIGLGTMGLAEMLIKLEIKYGSSESLEFIDDLYSFIAETAYIASSDLAKEKGSFPRFNRLSFLASKFVKQLDTDVRQLIDRNGIRNVTLITQAPTGTVGTMVGTSTGIEPFYFWSYFRQSRVGLHEEKVRVLEEWESLNPGKERPDYFVSAMDLSPAEHVMVQAAIQKWSDSAISKTCNCPSDFTIEQTKELYELMYDTGCKGGTIYRDKSRDVQVLSLKEETKEESTTPPSVELISEPKVRPIPSKRYGATVSKTTPAGTAHVTMNDDEEGRPFEIFIDIGKGGSDIKAMAEAMGRLASLVLRVSSPLSPRERIQEIVNQLSGIGGPRSSGFGKNRVKSLPDALAQALNEHYLSEIIYDENDVTTLDLYDEMPATQLKSSVKIDLCPSCGTLSLVSIEGCQSCTVCGHAEC